MNLKVVLTNSELEDVREILLDSLNIGDRELKRTLEKIAKSALQEYIDMITGVGMPGRVSDIQQLRIIKLITYYYGSLPTEEQVSKIFNITKSKAKTLIGNIKSIYRNQLKDIIKESIKSFLTSGEKVESNYEFIITSNAVIQELNDYLTINNPGLKKIRNKQDSIAKIEIPEDTYDYLCEAYEVEEDIEEDDE